MSYGVIACAVFLVSITCFEALPDDAQIFATNDARCFVFYWSTCFRTILLHRFARG